MGVKNIARPDVHDQGTRAPRTSFPSYSSSSSSSCPSTVAVAQHQLAPVFMPVAVVVLIVVVVGGVYPAVFALDGAEVRSLDQLSQVFRLAPPHEDVIDAALEVRVDVYSREWRQKRKRATRGGENRFHGE